MQHTNDLFCILLLIVQLCKLTGGIIHGLLRPNCLLSGMPLKLAIMIFTSMSGRASVNPILKVLSMRMSFARPQRKIALHVCLMIVLLLLIPIGTWAAVIILAFGLFSR